MAGWTWDKPALKQVVPGFVSMVFNAALCFILFSCALLVSQLHTGKNRAILFLSFSLPAALVSIITFLQFLFHFNTGIDQLFVTDKQKISAEHLYAGRMAYNSAICFSLLGLGFLLSAWQKRISNLIAQYSFHVVSVISAVALIGYMYGVSLFNTLFYVSSMATHTAILFFLLSVAASLLNPSIGITGLFMGKRMGNKMALRLFIILVIMVILFGSLLVQTQRHPVYDLDSNISLLAVGFLLISLLIIWYTAIWLNRIDQKRTNAENEVKRINAELEKRVEERTAESKKNEEKYYSLIEQASDAIYVLDMEMKFIDVNASMCKMMGYSKEELLNMNVKDIVDPEELKTDPLGNALKNPEKPVFRERTFMRKNGSTFPVELNVKIFPGQMVMVMARDISERKETESIILKEKMLSDTIINSLPGPFYLITEEGKQMRWNINFETITGYTGEEIEQLTPYDIIAPEDHQKVKEAMEKVFEEGYAIIEACIIAKDGTKTPLLLTGTPILYEGRRCLLGMGIDISSRIKAETELRASEQKYKLLFESSPMPLWMIDKDSLQIIAANDAVADLYGYTRDELVDMSVLNLRSDEDRARQIKGYRRDASDGAIDMGIVRHLKKDGTPMYVHIIAHDIVFEGRPVRLSFTNDVTEKLKAEESLQKSEANLQTILKTTKAAYALFDTELKVLAFNQKAIEFTQSQYDHIPQRGDLLAEYFPADRFPQFLSFTKEVLQGKDINYEIDYPQRDGRILWYDIRLSPISSDSKQILGMLMTLEEITERKNAEDALKDAYNRIQSQINSIKGMAWKQSHLMRSPLANLKALADLLKSHPADPETLQHFQTELDRLDTIIHEMARDASGHVL
jgi:PAS domain S-box-containing protein